MPPTPPLQAKLIARKLLRVLLLSPILAVLLFEEWGWEPLARCFKVLAKLPLWWAIERRLAHLPPWAALLVWVLPVLALVPVKLVALYLLGHGHIVLGFGLIIVAKIAGTAIAARLFQLTEPALMRLHWFARLCRPWKTWKDRLLAQVRDSALWRNIGKLTIRGKAAAKRNWLTLKTHFSTRTD